MRVYEFSKQYNIPAKDVISALQAEGFDIKSHMSVIDEQAIAFLKKAFRSNGKPEKSAVVTKPAVQKNTGAAPRPKSQPKRQSWVSSQPVEIQQPSGLLLAEMSVADFAHKACVQVADVILTLLKAGVVATKNKILPEDVILMLARHYEIEVLRPEAAVGAVDQLHKVPEEGVVASERLPIVVVLGHVDHGKTTLLDFIRKTRVASREKGGITQHIGAYEAKTEHGNIVFLDTPGHEAFSKIRKRGIHVADIVILIVAADDGVMPQTVEAVKQALAMKVPIIVAVNKIDKADISRVDVVKRELSQYGVIPEEWGGNVVFLPISAKTGKGVNELLEMIALQAQLMELKAADTYLARGFVLESSLEKGYGPVATIISQHGTMRVGDFFIAGHVVGKISVIVDSHGNRLLEAGPSVPVRVAGFEALPNVGDRFECVEKQAYLSLRGAKSVKQDNGNIQHSASKEDAFKVIIKTDTNSSREAIVDSLARLSHKTGQEINILMANVGGVTESDVELANNTGAVIVGLHIKVEPNAIALAQERRVTIHLFDIIYKLLEAIEEWTKKEAVVKKVYTRVGEATVLRVFDIKGVGVIAGSYVREGRFAVGGRVTVFRATKKIGEGVIKSLQREKKSVKEVHAGYECGFVVDGFNEWQPDDIVECSVELPVK